MSPNTPNIGDAITRIRPNAAFIVYDEDISKIEWNDTETECPTEEEILESLSILQLEVEYNSYKPLRQKAYPSIGDQLDALFHAGVFPDAMASKIQAIKDAYPKPNTDNKV
jgi:hypothetical protein